MTRPAMCDCSDQLFIFYARERVYWSNDPARHVL
jgi:hypothetical protein